MAGCGAPARGGARSAARERDNRAALAAAAKRIVDADSSYITVDVARHDDGSYRLRAVRRLRRAAVVEFVYGSLAANPPSVGKPLKLNLEGLHSARRGDYRMIYRIHHAEHRVDIIAVEHRADVYRPR